MIIAADYPFLDVMWTIFVFFIWVAWFMLLFRIFADIFRRQDLSGWGKTGWLIFTIILPFLGVFIYLITQGREMTERSLERAGAQRAEFDDYVRETARKRWLGDRDRPGQAAPRQRRDHAGGVPGAQGEGTGRVGPVTSPVRRPHSTTHCAAFVARSHHPDRMMRRYLGSRSTRQGEDERGRR